MTVYCITRHVKNRATVLKDHVQGHRVYTKTWNYHILSFSNRDDILKPQDTNANDITTHQIRTCFVVAASRKAKQKIRRDLRWPQILLLPPLHRVFSGGYRKVAGVRRGVCDGGNSSRVAILMT